MRLSPSSLDLAPFTTSFHRIGSYYILIGSNNWRSPAVEVTFSLACASSVDPPFIAVRLSSFDDVRFLSEHRKLRHFGSEATDASLLAVGNADVSARKKYVNLVDSVKNSGGSVHIFSSMHVSGEQLAQLSGIAAILRFPLPDLDDIEM
ncbi:hypothetical protein M5K25_010698 [Dendrobium thyrsiflorum]|uniref:eRF1 domain-containing protein n=1 Tax=Dendrobium thyrsiflorum TaxID=117978 RepID=A0ABD0V179_DENTH